MQTVPFSCDGLAVALCTPVWEPLGQAIKWEQYQAVCSLDGEGGALEMHGIIRVLCEWCDQCFGSA